MIACDTNLLVYAHREESPFHDRARKALIELAEGPELWAIPWACVHEFLAIVTHPPIFKAPTRMEDAWSFLNALFESPSLQLLAETSGYRAAFEAILRSSKVCGPKIHDARVAAICVIHAVQVLWTADRDLARFPVLKTANPLLG